MSTDLKSIKIIEFSGKKTEWKGWSGKFLARAHRNGFKNVLTGVEKIPTKMEYEAAVIVNDDDKIKAYDNNQTAYEELILSIDHKSKSGRVAFNLVQNCKSLNDYPDGNAKQAWDRLTAKYAPKTAPSLLQLKKDFENSKLESTEVDPEEWISELESMRTDMQQIGIAGKTDMSDQDFIIHILNNLPEKYDVVLDNLENKLMTDDKNNLLTIEEVREKLSGRYQRVNQKIQDDVHDREKALAAYEKYKKQFKGLCTRCGEYGHKNSDCPENLDEAKEKIFGGKCYHCGKRGHRLAECKTRKAPQDELAAEALSEESEEELVL